MPSQRRLLELHLPAEVYASALASLPKLKRTSLKLEQREHFVLENSDSLLLIAVSSSIVDIKEIKP